MKRNLLWVLLILYLSSWLRPAADRHCYDPNGGPLTVDGIRAGESFFTIQRRLGLSVPYRGFWLFGENRMTRVRLVPNLATGDSVAARVEGRRLRQDGRLLAQVGDSRSAVRWSLGAEVRLSDCDPCVKDFAPWWPADERVIYEAGPCVVGFSGGRAAWVAVLW